MDAYRLKKEELNILEQQIDTKQYSNLYHQNIGDMKFGFTQGEKANHILKKHGKGMLGQMKTALHKGTDVEVAKEGELSQEVKNEGRDRTLSLEKDREQFTQLAQYSAREYERFPNNADIKSVMHQVREYVTAETRADQEEQLRDLFEKINQTKAKFQTQQLAEDSEEMKSIIRLENTLKANTYGTLKIPEMMIDNIKQQKVIEPPLNANEGYFWEDRKDHILFPHTPAITDLRKQDKDENPQMVKGLAQIIKMNPDYIKQSMMDMGDGTVAVRFNAWTDNEEERGEEKIFIRVNKSVVKTMDVYADASNYDFLWVEMIKKAYSIYKNISNLPANCDKVANYADSAFIKAFTPKYSEE